jgi:hypothetical protein
MLPDAVTGDPPEYVAVASQYTVPLLEPRFHVAVTGEVPDTLAEPVSIVALLG